METAIFILTVLICILLIIARLWIPSYVKKMAELEAQTQYTAILTKVEQTVKMEFDIQRAELNAKLDFLTNHQLDIISSEKTAILELAFTLTKFMDICEHATKAYSTADYYQDDSLDKYIRDREEAYNQFILSQSTGKILIANQDILDLADKLYTLILENQFKTGTNFIFSMKRINLNKRHTIDLLPPAEAVQKEGELLKDIREAIDKNNTEISSVLQLRVNLIKEFQKACQDHIYKLLRK